MIDDNESITKMFCRLATMKKHEVIVSNDARSGLALLENELFDITLLDISMPGFTGIDIVDTLNKSGRIKEQKICILTASPGIDKVRDSLLAKGIRECLQKPMSAHTLLDTLESLANN